MRGRKPKPTYLKIVTGNPGRRPLNTREPKPQGDLKSPPEWLTNAQRDVWTYAVTNAPSGLLTLLDKNAFMVWIVACEIHERATRQQIKLDSSGGLDLLVKTKEGHLIQSPYLPIINRQAQIMLKAAAELGFTPSARSRVRINGEQEEDPSDRFFG